MKITHALQQKVIAKYKDIIEHQVTIIEVQRDKIQKLEQELEKFKQVHHVKLPKTGLGVLKEKFAVLVK
ncbi:hypothetical protein [Acinetobacter puyangensis]|uniref:Uncharacterized protein n=1 Tax=Acinetobacter puyangensis TaxID=1096779 RepID=A0A240E4F7_9GAMM|nr:hypothetical protein [Acinetobacter puyangensis]SNX43648.1 hypothetical protein SAMN05421731_101690 [Acinetobacter puyangensis]